MPSLPRLLILALALGLVPAGLAQPAPRREEPRLDTDAARRTLLNLINEQRRVAGAPPVELDDTASRAGVGHATELARDNFLSHWNQAGLLPYMRYSLVGGTDYNAENVSRLSGIHPAEKGDRLIEYLKEMHNSMHDEKPPRDGHRQTILNPAHTHVGFGIAVEGEHLALTEEFLSRYVVMDPPPKSLKPGLKFPLSGRLLDPMKCQLYTIVIYFEPIPKPMTIAQLNRTYAYGFPAESRQLKPVLTNGAIYADGSKGEIETGSGGRFTALLELWKPGPGIYTVVAFITRPGAKKPFPVTNVCFRVD
jgi:uncharacterized protein YkwD